MSPNIEQLLQMIEPCQALTDLRAILAVHDLVPIGNLSESDCVAIRLSQENESLRAELAALKEWAPGAIHQWQERAGKLRRKQDRRPSLEWLQKWRERAETSSEKLLELIKKYAWRKESFFWREDRCPRRTYLRGYVTHRHDRLLRRIDRRIKEARG